VRLPHIFKDSPFPLFSTQLFPGNGRFPWSGALNSLNFHQRCQPANIFKILTNGKGKCFRCMLLKFLLKDENQDIT